MNDTEKERMLEILDRWDAANTIAAACTDEVFALVRRSDRTTPTPRRISHLYNVFDRVSQLPIVDLSALCVHWNGRTCRMGHSLGFRLLVVLARRPNRYVGYAELLDEVWGGRRSDATIRSAVRELRRRLRCAGMADLAKAIDGSSPGYYGLILDPPQ